jgi:hypothetical protein
MDIPVVEVQNGSSSHYCQRLGLGKPGHAQAFQVSA